MVFFWETNLMQAQTLQKTVALFTPSEMIASATLIKARIILAVE